MRTLGVAVGNVFDIETQDWLTLIAGFASIVLTFLAGMEVDPAYMRRRLEASVGIGVASFAGPFVFASLVAFFLLDWTLKASLIAGTALSTTSLAVVYAVLVERGLTDVGIGRSCAWWTPVRRAEPPGPVRCGSCCSRNGSTPGWPTVR